MKGFLAIALAMIWVGSAHAQFVKTKVTASNGVEVIQSVDEFAGRYEFTAPSIEFTTSKKGGTGFALVALLRTNTINSGAEIQGAIFYKGDWEYFNSAVFRGGGAVNYTRLGGDVGSCRYGCNLSEDFSISLTAEEISKYAVDGVVEMQIRGTSSGNTAMLKVPVAYIEAVTEVGNSSQQPSPESPEPG